VADCIFCDMLTGRRPSSLVFQDVQCAVFLDIQPVNPGHMLIVPNRHATSLVELDVETGGHMFRVAQWLAQALRQSGLRCEGVNLFLADGEVAGQEVFHVHLHVIPRFAGDGFGLRFGPANRNRPPRAELDEIATRVKAAL
jgi:histidine triad (HIT) family protein